MRAWAAIGLELVFLSLAFGWRSWVQWRRTGSTGFIRPRRGAPPVEFAGATGFILAVALLMAAPIADLAGLARIDPLDADRIAVAGLVLGGAGIILTLVSQLALGDSWRIGVDPAERTALVTRGVYGRVRNPIFTAMLVASVGIVLLVPNLVSIAALVFLASSLEVQVRFVEEPYLHVTHGGDYARYQEVAGRFLPGIGTSTAR